MFGASFSFRKVGEVVGEGEIIRYLIVLPWRARIGRMTSLTFAASFPITMLH